MCRKSNQAAQLLFTYYTIILGGGGGSRAIMMLMTQGRVGGPKLAQSWRRNMWALPKPKWGNIFFFKPPQNHPKNGGPPNFFTYSYWPLCVRFRKPQTLTFMRNLGCAPHTWSWMIFWHFPNTACCCFFTQLLNKLQQCSLYELIKNILLFVLNTKQPLSNIWLLRYKQNSFGCFFKSTQNCFAYISATKYYSDAVLYSKQTAG